MIINLIRIDDRLIHGQVIIWTKNIKINRIIIVNDIIAKDKLRKKLLMQISPPDISSHVVSINKIFRVFNNSKYINDKVMLLFTNPNDILRIVKNGIIISSVNVGCMAYYKNKIQISETVSVDKNDVHAFKQLNKMNINLEIRKLPQDKPLKIIHLIEKLYI